MLQGWLILVISFAYLGLLFAIAYLGDKRADAGRSVVNSPYIYALSLAVYCTSWTFYGSVGRATSSGVNFLAIYIGPTLMAALWWLVLRKMIRISKIYRVTSIADFIGTRHLDAAERHEGMVAAIAFESLIKLLASLAVGLFVTFGMYGSFGDLFA